MAKNAKKSKKSKKSKKIEKIDFFENVKNGFQGSQSVSGTVLGAVWDPWKPFLTIKKKKKIDFFSDFFLFLRFFWGAFLALYNGSLIFDFGPADYHKVPWRYPTHYFLESWTSGEYLRALVCHRRGSFQPVLARNLRSTEHPPRWILGPLPALKVSFFKIWVFWRRSTPIFYFGFRFGRMKGISDRNCSA